MSVVARTALRVRPLTREAFAPYGDVIDAEGAKKVFSINGGTAKRFHDLMDIDVDDAGHPIVSLFRAQHRTLPIDIRILERHPLGSQAFMPLGPHPWLVVVSESLDAEPLAFLVRPGQGVNLKRGLWHHAMLALNEESTFLVIDRGGEGNNMEESPLSSEYVIDSLVVAD